MHPFVAAVISIALSVSAQFVLKSGMRRLGRVGATAGTRAMGGMSPGGLWAAVTEPRLALGFLLYGLSAILWLSVLAKWDVSKAYPLVGAGFLAALVVGMIDGESVSLPRAVGVAFIGLGVLLVGRS